MPEIQTGNALLDAPALLSAVGIDKGMTVADLGCGTLGHFTFPAAHMVGSEGKVYAVDILQSALTAIKSRVKLEGVDNVKTVWGDLEVSNGIRISDQQVDIVIMVNTPHLILKKQGILNEVDRLLRTGGRILAADWAPGTAGFGPTDDRRVGLDDMAEVFTDYGYDVKNQFEAGPYHWGLIIEKPNSTL